MKSARIFVCLLLFLISLPLFAEKTSVHTIHLSFPVETRTLKATKSHSHKYFDFGSDLNANYFGACVNWNKLIFRESGFSLLFGVEAGFSAAKIPDISSDFFIGGVVNMAAGKFGIGFAPLKTEKHIFAFHGFSELNGHLMDVDSQFSVGSVSDSLDYVLLEVNFVIGADAVFILKLGERISLFSGLDVSTVLFGGGSIEARRGNKMAESEEFTYISVLNGITVVPRIGLCWGF